MTIQWSLFAPGVLLLLLPADRLLSPLVRLRSFSCFQTLETGGHRHPWWWVAALWPDPLRGFAGAYLLKTCLIGSPYWASLAKGPYAVAIVLLCVAVLAQMFTRVEHDAFLAPVGFVAGIIAALTPWPVALIGMTMAVTGMFAFRCFYGFFGSGFAAVGFLGFVLETGAVWLVPALAVLSVPLVVSALTSRPLEIPTAAR